MIIGARFSLWKKKHLGLKLKESHFYRLLEKDLFSDLCPNAVLFPSLLIMLFRAVLASYQGLWLLHSCTQDDVSIRHFNANLLSSTLFDIFSHGEAAENGGCKELLTGGVIVRALINQVISAAMTQARVTPRGPVIRF